MVKQAGLALMEPVRGGSQSPPTDDWNSPTTSIPAVPASLDASPGGVVDGDGNVPPPEPSQPIPIAGIFKPSQVPSEASVVRGSIPLGRVAETTGIVGGHDSVGRSEASLLPSMCATAPVAHIFGVQVYEP